MAENTISPKLLDQIAQSAGSFGPVLGSAFGAGIGGTRSRMNMNVAPENFTAPIDAEGMNMNVAPENFTAPILPERMNMNVAPESMNKGATSDQELMMMQGTGEDDLGARIEALMQQINQSTDPDEKSHLQQTLSRMVLGANAPLAKEALAVQQAGTGEDTLLAHLAPGEVVLPPEFLDDPELEGLIEQKFKESGIDPAQAIAGVGIASLNEMTGLEEFGFFKKLGKSLKKIAKKIAPIAGPLANFIPGVGPLVAGAIGAATNLAAGKGLKGAITGGLSGYGVGKALGGIGSLSGTAAGSASKFAGQGFGAKLSSLRAGLGSLPGEGFFGTAKEFLTKGVDDVGLLGNLQKAGGYMMGAPRGSDAFLGQQAVQQDIAELQQQAAAAGQAGNTDLQFQLEQQANALIGSQQQGGGLFTGGGRDGVGNFGRVGDFFGGAPRQQLYDAQGNPVQQSGGFLSNLLGLGGGGGGGGLGSLAMAGVPAYMLGKLAMDEAKKDKGVPMTPLTTMDAGGRYNIEAEIARRMGRDAPNPVEFGLQPRFPTLSGGQAGPRKEAVTSQYVQNASMGGAMQPIYPMAYANGGDVAMEDFQEMNGYINGPGTETSDDIPAMLSDGEFVMTGQAVRGAGSFDLNEEPNGILTLVPSASEDRERGTQLMYQMMDVFGRYANATS